MEDISIDLKKFTCDQLKVFLLNHNIKPPSRSKKENLIELTIDYINTTKVHPTSKPKGKTEPMNFSQTSSQLSTQLHLSDSDTDTETPLIRVNKKFNVNSEEELSESLANTSLTQDDEEESSSNFP